MRHKPGAFDASTFSSRARACGTCVSEATAEDESKKTKVVKKKKAATSGSKGGKELSYDAIRRTKTR